MGYSSLALLPCGFSCFFFLREEKEGEGIVGRRCGGKIAGCFEQAPIFLKKEGLFLHEFTSTGVNCLIFLWAYGDLGVL